MNCLRIASVALLLALSSAPIVEAQAPGGTPCFCLWDPVDQYFQKGCEERKVRASPTRTYCWDETQNAMSETPFDTTGFERIDAGEGDCAPCTALRRFDYEPLRSDGRPVETLWRAVRKHTDYVIWYFAP